MLATLSTLKGLPLFMNNAEMLRHVRLHSKPSPTLRTLVTDSLMYSLCMLVQARLVNILLSTALHIALKRLNLCMNTGVDR